MGVDKHPPPTQSKRTKPQYAFQYELIHTVWADTLQSSKAWGLVASQVAAELLKVTEMRAVVCLVDYRPSRERDFLALEASQL